MKSIFDIQYGKLPEQILDIHLPDCEEFPVFIYFHGGGIEEGGKGLPDFIKEYFTNNGIALVSADYRMYPTAHFPDYIIDAAKAVKWVQNNMSQYGKVTHTFIGGASAGAYISMMLCFNKFFLANEGVNPYLITGYIHDAGQPTTHFNILKHERGMHQNAVVVDEAAPLYYINNRDMVKTNMLFIVSDNDMPGRYEQTMLTLATLKNFSHDMENKIELKVMHGGHVEYVCKQDENGESVYGQMIVPFIQKKVNEAK